MSLVNYIYVAEIRTLVQVSPDSFETQVRTKVFDENATIKDIHTWAAQYQKNDNILLTISD